MFLDILLYFSEKKINFFKRGKNPLCFSKKADFFEKKNLLHISKKAISIFSEKKKVSQVKKNQTQILEAF